MAETLIIIGVLVWGPVLLYTIGNRGFIVLLVWLFIAPIASAVLTSRSGIQWSEVSAVEGTWEREGPRGYLSEKEASLTLKDLIEPTRLLIGAFVLVFGLGALLKKKILRPLDSTEIFMCVFSLIVLTSVLLQSRRMAFGLRVASDAFIIPFAAYAIARRIVITEDHLRKVCKVIIYMGFYAIILSLIERLLSEGFYRRLNGPFVGPIPLYVAMQTVFFVGLLSLRGGLNRGNFEKGFPGRVHRFVLYCAPLIILLTWTRGNWLGFLMGVAVFLAFGHRFINPSRKLAMIGAALVFISIMVVAILTPPLTTILEDRVTHRIDTVQSRLGAWTVIIRESVDSPVLGVGLNNMRDFLAMNRIQYEDTWSLTTTHNSFLSMLSELGIIGLLTYLAIVVSIIRMGLNMNRAGRRIEERWRGTAVIAIMTAYLVPALFANTLYHNSILTHLYVYVVMGGIAGLHRQLRPVPVMDVRLRSKLRMYRVVPRTARREQEAIPNENANPLRL